MAGSKGRYDLCVCGRLNCVISLVQYSRVISECCRDKRLIYKALYNLITLLCLLLILVFATHIDNIAIDGLVLS